MRILLIDDDDLFLFLTERTLKKATCLKEINSIANVEEAKNYLDSCVSRQIPLPDIIFVDMNMPGMNGKDFAHYYNQKFAGLYPGTKLVILTSSISRKEKVVTMEIPSVKDFIQKPLTEEKLLSLI